VWDKYSVLAFRLSVRMKKMWEKLRYFDEIRQTVHDLY